MNIYAKLKKSGVKLGYFSRLALGGADTGTRIKLMDANDETKELVKRALDVIMFDLQEIKNQIEA